MRDGSNRGLRGRGAPRNGVAAAVLAGVLTVGLGVEAARAQNQATDTASEEVQQRQEDIRRQETIGIRAADAILDRDCAPVSYRDILAAPDDVGLNVCYARQQIENGDLRGAAATLERILLLKPDQADVRLMYAMVLYRLDNLDEAAQEFRAVRDLPMTADERALIARYLEQIAQRQKRTKHVVTVAAGMHYDTNRNAAPRSEELEALGATTPIANDEDRPEDDFGFMGSARYDITHDLGKQRPHEAIGSVTLYQDEQVTRDELDVQSLSMEGGAKLYFPQFVVTPTVEYTNLALSRQKAYSGYGAGIRIDHRHRLKGVSAPPLDTYASYDIKHESFHNIQENRSLTDRSGQRMAFRLGVSARVAPNHRLGLHGTQVYKEGSRNTATYRFWKGEIRHTWLLGEGRFLLTSASFGVRMYRTPDPFVVGTVAPVRRREEPKRLRVTYGMPAGDLLDTIADQFDESADGPVRDFLEDATFTATGEYLRQQANITNFDYKNLRGQLLLSKRFRF